MLKKISTKCKKSDYPAGQSDSVTNKIVCELKQLNNNANILIISELAKKTSQIASFCEEKSFFLRASQGLFMKINFIDNTTNNNHQSQNVES